MNQQDEARYDLGEIHLDGRLTDFPTAPGGARGRGHRRAGSAGSHYGTGRIGGTLAGSLSLFVPGLGEMVAGEFAWGLFYLTGIGFCAAMLWATVRTLDSLVATLQVLGVPLPLLVGAMLLLAGSAALLHLAGIMHAHAIGDGPSGHASPHPIVTSLASLLVPGWGQLLAGHRRRATMFLGALWLFAAAWLLVTPRATALLASLHVALPDGVRDGWGPAVLLAGPIVTWALAVYDAAAGAVAERRA